MKNFFPTVKASEYSKLEVRPTARILPNEPTDKYINVNNNNKRHPEVC